MNNSKLTNKGNSLRVWPPNSIRTGLALSLCSTEEKNNSCTAVFVLSYSSTTSRPSKRLSTMT